MSMVIKVIEFSEFPGPRFRDLGPASGEEFRDDVLVPAIVQNKGDVIVNLDGTMGFGSSFLEEAFGGMIRKGVDQELVAQVLDNLISDEDPSIIDEIKGYVQEEVERKSADAERS